MLTEFIQGKEYKILDWKTLIAMEGVQRYQDACGYDWVSYKNNHYSKQHIDAIEGLQFVADELEYQNYDEMVIQPWICEELLPEFVVGKQYELLGLEDIKKIPGIQLQNDDEYSINEESDQYLSDMDEYKGTIFTATSPTNFTISCWNIEPWMCKLVNTKVKEKETVTIGVDTKVRELTLLYLQKNHDYGNSVGITRAVLGKNSDLVRISDKINRIKTLQTKEGFVSEKVEDTIFDLVNYYAIYTASKANDTLLDFVTALECALKVPEKMLADLKGELSTVILDEKTSDFIKEFISTNC